MVSLAIYTITGLLGQEVVTAAIRNTANSVYTMMYSFINHPEINKCLVTLDTKATVKTVESIIKHIDIENIGEPLHVALNQVHQALCEIIDDLSKINYTLQSYNKKWFKSFRKFFKMGVINDYISSHRY